MKRAILSIAIVIFAASVCEGKKIELEPDGTYLFAQKDGQDLFMDIYEPGSTTGKASAKEDAPTVVFMFGGGFKTGARNENIYLEWFKSMQESGIRIVSIDYRLGMKGVKGKKFSKKFINSLSNAIDIAVEDLFSATSFIIANASQLGIDTGKLIISGSSAGAITSLQAEYCICSGNKSAELLPAGFNYAGVMAFSGAVYSLKGTPEYKTAPCPILMFHGTDDNIVPYDKIKFLNIFFGGASALTEIYDKAGFCYQTFRIKGHYHEIAISMQNFLPEELRFINDNIKNGIGKIVDATITDPSIPIPNWAKGQTEELYK